LSKLHHPCKLNRFDVCQVYMPCVTASCHHAAGGASLTYRHSMRSHTLSQ
jgi:hypothetical protein